MAIQRAIVKGTVLDLVETRNIFTAEVDAIGGDTPADLWTAYLNSVYEPLVPVLMYFTVTTTYEIEEYTSNQWAPIDEVTFSTAGTVQSGQGPNAVAGVLIGKATGLRGTGRKFFSGLATTMYAGNHLGSTALAAFVLVLAAYLTPLVGIGGGTLVPGIFDKNKTFRPFVGGFVSSFLGSMRRRKPGVGM